MKVAFFTECYHPIINGVVISIDTYKKALENKNIDCFVFAPSHRNYKDKDENVFRFRSFPYPVRIDYRLPLPLPIATLRKIKELQIDIIHTHSPFFAGLLALYVARRNNLPLVFTHHTQYHQYVHYAPLLPKRILQNGVISWSKFYCNKCNLIIAPSEGLKQMLIRYGVEKEILLLPTGIELTNYLNLDNRWAKEKYNIKDKFIIITVSRLAKEKNIEFLLEVFKELINELQDVIYFIVGGGPVKNHLEKYAHQLGIENNVIFTGYVSQKEVINYLSFADIFLFASNTETQGLVVLEAMAAGCVPVCLNAVGINEVIDNGINGFLCPYDKEYFKNKIIEVLKDTELKNKLSNEAKNKAKEFNSNNLVEKLIEWYNRIKK